MSKNDSSFAVHVWRRVAGEERLLGVPAPVGAPEWIAAAPGLIRPQVAHGASKAEAFGNVVLALAAMRCGRAPSVRVVEGRMLSVPDAERVGSRPATDAEVAQMLGLLPGA